MKLVVDGATYRGRALDLAGADLPPPAVAAAIRGEPTGVAVSVDAPEPGPGHETLVRAAAADSVRGALAAAARSRGRRAPQREALERVGERLAALEPPEPPEGLADARRRVADAGETEERRRERVAALRGRLRAVREAGGDGETVAADLADAVAALSEAETERIAAEQALAAAEREAREARDRRERRLRLEDRAGNLRRAARAALASSLADEFADAVAAVPGEGRLDNPGDPGTFDGDPAVAALAAVRLADLDAPVVLSGRRFPDAAAAAGTLGCPVVRL